MPRPRSPAPARRPGLAARVGSRSRRSHGDRAPAPQPRRCSINRELSSESRVIVVILRARRGQMTLIRDSRASCSIVTTAPSGIALASLWATVVFPEPVPPAIPTTKGGLPSIGHPTWPAGQRDTWHRVASKGTPPLKFDVMSPAYGRSTQSPPSHEAPSARVRKAGAELLVFGS